MNIIECSGPHCKKKLPVRETWQGWVWTVDTREFYKNKWECFCSWSCVAEYALLEH